MTILDEIIANRKQNLPRIKEILEINQNSLISQELMNRSTLSDQFKNLTEIGIIAELKAASPSQGKILPSIPEHNLVNLQREILIPTIPEIDKKIQSMLKGGAKALSILTEPCYFHGSFGNLLHAARIVPQSIPIVLKDFIIDESQVRLGKLCGASNGLVIVKMGEVEKIVNSMIKHSMEPLIEIHDLKDLEEIQSFAHSGLSFVIGINNRNLQDLSIDLHTTNRLAPLIHEQFGKDQLVITESGINSRNDILRLHPSGVKGALIGTSVMQGNIEEKLKQLNSYKRPFIKICGISELKTLDSLNDPAINAFGVVVGVPQSIRNLNIEKAKEICAAAPKDLFRTLVTKDKTVKELLEFNEKLSPDLIQLHGKEIRKEFRTLPAEIRQKLIIPVRIEKGSTRGAMREIEELPKDIFAISVDSSEGTGIPLDIQATKELFLIFPDHRFIIAGGLGAHNIQTILKEIQPFGIDASSALEENGKKDNELIKLFVKKASFPKNNQNKFIVN